VQAAGTVLTREHLVDRLWPDTVVEEGSLTSHISLLGKTLGKNSNGQEFIETPSKRGYRFVATVTLAASEVPESVLSRITLVVLPFENYIVTGSITGLSFTAACFGHAFSAMGPEPFCLTAPIRILGNFYATVLIAPYARGISSRIRSSPPLPKGH
jgi:hypothetical protein